MDKIIVSAAIVGAGSQRSHNPNLPITPMEIADSAIEAAEAGAGIVHIHVRDPKTEQPSHDLELFRQVVDRIRSKSDVVLNLSTGEGGRLVISSEAAIDGDASTLLPPEERVAHVAELKPEICSLDIGTMNFGPRLFVNVQPVVDRMAELIIDTGAKPEIELFDIGHIEIARRLIDKGLISGKPHFQLCMGTAGGLAGNPRNAVFFSGQLPQDSTWSIFGVAHAQFPMVAMGTLLGGHVRVGMEDNLYLSRGVKAGSNAELVERAVAIIGNLNREIATPDDTRKILGLKGA